MRLGLEPAATDREAPDTRARRKAVVKHLRVAALSLNAGVNNAPDKAPVNWNNDAFICQRAASSIDSCTRRAVAHVLFDDSSKNRVERGRCGHRLCPHCHKVIATRVGLALTEIVTAELNAGSHLAMLTLPIRHTRRDSLKEARNALRKANADLLKRELWRSLVAEYHRVAEVERGRKNGWNAHYHTLIKVRFSKDRAQALWRNGWLDKPLSVIRREARDGMKAAKRWRRGALADLKRERETWRDLPRSQREEKARAARAVIYAEYSRRVDMPLQLSLFVWWCKLRKRKLAAVLADLKTERKRCLLEASGRDAKKAVKRRIKSEMQAAHLAWACNPAEYVTTSHAEIEDWLREEWRIVTRSVGRESYVLRYDAWKPGAAPSTIKWVRKKQGKPVGAPYDVPITKAVQELVKYTTKGHGKALKKGQVGFFEYTPWEVADYLKGVRNWHLHQSSKGWIAAQHAYEAEQSTLDAQCEREEGSRRVSFVELVKDLEDAVAGALDDSAREAVIKTGVAILELHKKERADDPEFASEQYDAIASHVARLLGDDRSTPVNFKLTLPEQRELARLRGRAPGAGVDVDQLLLAVRARQREVAEISRELADLPGEEHFSSNGQRLSMKLRQAEQRLKFALDAVREAEERKRREMQVDAYVTMQREQAEYFGEREEEAHAL
ncbi:hypothetical protein BURC_03716 [Burkholderiaceae bacterium]|nr:hypothetical protein BURC_03716 [Burkholderiaceae bacterium]